MFLGLAAEHWLTAIAGALTVLTIATGVYGLYSDNHTEDGKLTRSGRQVVALIIALGILSFVSGVVSQVVAGIKERQAAAEQTARFERQMTALREVTLRLVRVQASLQDATRRQEDLQSLADRNLHMGERLQSQAQGNTLQVLRRVFSEANRIAAERVAIRVTYNCPPIPSHMDGPRLDTVLLMVNDQSGRELSLSTRQNVPLGNGMIFHGFHGDMGALETFAGWQNATISISLDGMPPGSRGGSLEDYAIYSPEELAERRRPLPQSFACPVVVGLLLNGRQVLTASSELRFRGSYRYGVSFVNLRVNPARLPRM